MRLRSGVVVLGMLLGATGFSANAATFDVPKNFEIMFIDLDKKGAFENDFHAKLDAGEHQIVVRFNQRIGNASDGQQFESEPQIIELELAQNSQIVLEAPYFFQENDAARYAKSPEFTLVDKANDGELEYEVRALPHKAGFQNMRDYEEEVREFTATYKETNPDSPSAADANAPATEELEMLKFWYNKADAQTRKDIRFWLIDDAHEVKDTNTPFDMTQFWFQKASKKDQKAFQVWLLNE